MIVKCPLCSNKKFFSIREYNISHLSNLWIKGFGFNPFEKIEAVALKKCRCLQCDLIFYDPLFPGDEKFYEKLSSIMPGYYDSERWEFDKAIEIIQDKKPNSILEIGCGTGNFLDKIRHAVDDLAGIEINAKAINTCLQKSLSVSNDIPDQKYDMIVTFEVMEHIHEIYEMIARLVKHTHHNGFILIAVPNPDSYLKDIDISLLDLPPHHSLGITKKSLDWIGNEFDLSEISYSREPIRYVHYASYIASLNSFSYSENKIKRKFQSMFISLIQKSLLPALFPMTKDDLIGQTHLILFQKKSL